MNDHYNKNDFFAILSLIDSSEKIFKKKLRFLVFFSVSGNLTQEEEKSFIE